MNNLELRSKLEEIFFDFHIRGCKLSDKKTNKMCEEIKQITITEILALIGKCATPTFSGEGERYSASDLLDIWNHKKMPHEIEPTEQKEYCQDKNHYRGGSDKGINICMDCGKPIPAEKKECEHDWKLEYTTDGNIDTNTYKTFSCTQCGKEKTEKVVNPEPKPKECEHEWGIHCLTSYPPTYIYKCKLCGEPKPKDRIEELRLSSDLAYNSNHWKEVVDKINELIKAYNKEH